MKADAFANFTMTYLPAVGLLMFLSVFVGACIWVFRGSSNEFYKKLSNIPFEKDEK